MSSDVSRSTQLKLALYLIFTISACTFGYLFYSHYHRLMARETEVSAQAQVEVPALDEMPEAYRTTGFARLMIMGIFFFISIAGLALLVAHDLSQFLGGRALKVLYNEEGEGPASADYEQAEQEWANGQHLEAIRLMREYLNKHPREQHVALRIAEIYEKDLNNPLAAALEYEEVLKHKLPPENWGWAAIHLCNLYFKLNHPDKAIALLREIDSKYPDTAAAGKARKRLDMMDEESSDQAEVS
jgi:tetratricopeptide (TPR) repeat protein